MQPRDRQLVPASAPEGPWCPWSGRQLTADLPGWHTATARSFAAVPV